MNHPKPAAPISHVGFVVDDLEKAATEWARTLGAGPFFVLPDIAFDQLDAPGAADPRWEHSAAFGQWGGIAVELQQMDAISPAGLHDDLVPVSGTLNHVAYVVDDPVAESLRLEGLGLPRFLTAQNAHADIRWHRAPFAGHAIEIHRGSDFVSGFFSALADRARTWDGKDPVRTDGP